MNKVAIYCRVSTEEQAQKQSIQNQVESGKEFCQREGLLIHDFYLDNGISGTIPLEERPEGKRLLEDASKGSFESVIIWKIDRLGRDTKNSLVIAHKLRELGISIKSMTEPFDTSTPIGEFMFTQLASMAKLERDNIRERSMLGTNRVAKTGKWLGGIVPYGYSLDENSFPIINKEKLPNSNYTEVEIIIMIFDWIGDQKLSCLKVAEKLNSLNIPTHYFKDGRRKKRLSNRWSQGAVGRIIKNTMYMGTHIYGKKSRGTRDLIERVVPFIVSKELWYKAQETLKNNYNWGKQKPKRKYLLRGLIKCDKCGRTYIGYFHRNKTWYRCNGNSKTVEVAFGERCRSKNIKGEWIDEFVWEEIKSWILNQEQLEMILEAKLEEIEKDKRSYFAKSSNVKIQIQNKENEKQNILSLYRKNMIEIKDVGIQLEEIEKEKEQLELIYQDLKSKVIEDLPREQVIKGITKNLNSFIDKLKKEEVSFDDMRQIIETFIKEVNVHLTISNRPAVFIDTIPFRKNISNKRISKKVLETIKLRINRTSDQKTESLQEDTMNIVYKFNLPSKEVVNGLNTRMPVWLLR